MRKTCIYRSVLDFCILICFKIFKITQILDLYFYGSEKKTIGRDGRPAVGKRLKSTLGGVK